MHEQEPHFSDTSEIMDYDKKLWAPFPRRCFSNDGMPCREIRSLAFAISSDVDLRQYSEETGLGLAIEKAEEIDTECKFGIDRQALTCGRNIVGYVGKKPGAI